MSAPASTDSLLYDTQLRIMDMIEVLDKKVTRLLAAAGVDEATVPELGETT